MRFRTFYETGRRDSDNSVPPFKAGDRIQIGDSTGDVLDIGSFSTAIMEIREWIDADQYTGRILHIPNSFALNQTIKNYTRDYSFIWMKSGFC